MTPFAIFFVGVASLLLLILPRRFAALPLIVVACYLTLGQTILIGPFHFSALRIVLAMGFLRVLIRGEWKIELNILDRIMFLWSVWLILASFFREDPHATLIGHLGRSYDSLGTYLLIRCLCISIDDVKTIIKFVALIFIPLGIEMLYEQMTRHNLFSIFGGVPPTPKVRHGHIRAQGPFLHAILSGTVAAAWVPLLMGIWWENPKRTLLGIAGCLLMVFTCFSSGPIMTLILGSLAVLFWRWRHLTKYTYRIMIITYILLSMVMSSPPYYLLQKIDITGGSTGWHRARLIRSTIEHFNEWWFAGTDYTRHWMPTGVSWSKKHTDITNYYIRMAIEGGLLLMLLFIALLYFGFKLLHKSIYSNNKLCTQNAFFIWCIGASLFAHACTFISVSYFDQSSLFFYLTIAMVSSVVNICYSTFGLVSTVS